MKLLVLNAGSSSQKSCLYEITDKSLPLYPPKALWESKVDWSQGRTGQVETTTSSGVSIRSKIPAQSRLEVTQHVLKTLYEGETRVLSNLSEISGVGHRVVHGGTQYVESTRITSDVKAAINDLARLAPLHNPINLEGIEAIEQTLGAVPQVAVFDTAFHAKLPLSATVYPGPYDWFRQEIRRYGFHGISHQYCTQRSAQILGKNQEALRLIVCHLGNGCSLSAIRDGHSINTTMGFTPLEGLMMGTRSGSIDPSILIYLMRQGNTADQLEQMLNKQSGLKGISGVSADLRQVQKAAASGNAQAQLALDIFIHRLRSAIGEMLMSLDRLDAIVFTGGIGENSSLIRASACSALSPYGLEINTNLNEKQPIDQDIATAESAVRALVIHTQEDWMIAKDCWKILSGQSLSTH
jgi:acetate kinase